jgi:hypothetical protein
MGLSRRRAKNVSQALIKPFGISPERLSTRAMGETAPIDSNDTSTGRNRNRRVTFINYKIGECEPTGAFIAPARSALEPLPPPNP